MGNGFAVSCSNCGYYKYLKVGVGIVFYTTEDIIDLIHPMRRPKLTKILKEYTVHKKSYEHRIYRCERCGHLRNPFWAKIVYGDGEVYETQFKCGKCQKSMTNVCDHLKLNNKLCPCCRQDELRATAVVY